MLYLVDGYNVTRADDATRRLHPSEMRLELTRRLAARGKELLGPGDIVVVWDKGPEDDAGIAPVTTLFAGAHETADDVIARIAGENPGKVSVVTSDRELRDRVRTAAGAATPLLGASALFESRRVDRRGGRRAGGSAGGREGLPPGHRSITEELGRIWLGDGENEPPVDDE